LQLAVWDGQLTADPAGTAVDLTRWQRSGHRTEVIRTSGRGAPGAGRRTVPVRELRAMVFSDVAGFSRLTDASIPTFMDHVMARLADTIDAYGDDVLVRQTWGDGLYLVLRDVPSAARCALALQQTFAAIDLQTLGLGALRGMRIGAHAGPVFRGTDHIRREVAFYGSAVVRAARIEPRTPEGQVYVTHPFAALAALEGDESWTCEYVGVAPTDKGYGELPMFVLRDRRPCGHSGPVPEHPG
jgi:class 3 adenylate cyclase